MAAAKPTIHASAVLVSAHGQAARVVDAHHVQLDRDVAARDAAVEVGDAGG